MAEKTSPPSVRETAFDCPHCGAYATQHWFSLHANSIAGERKTPDIPDENFKAGINSNNIDAGTNERLTEWIRKMESGLIFFQEGEGEFRTFSRVNNLHASRCSRCDQTALWVHDNLVFPFRKTGARPNLDSDLPETGKHDFAEARYALNILLRSTAALFRLGFQRVRVLLGEGWLILKKAYSSMRKFLTIDATKPLYKQWWVWMLALLILPSMYWMIAPNTKPPTYKKISPAEHLSYAQNALEHKNFSAAMHHLDAIPKDSPLFVAVEILRKAIIEKQQQEEMVKQAAEKKENALVLMQARLAFAKTYEKELLQQGMDASVTTQGEDHSVLYIRYLLMDKPFVSKLSSNKEFIDTLQRMEFKKVQLTNGYDESWTVNP